MADKPDKQTKTDPYTTASPDIWSGMAPFVQAAFDMNKANAAQQAAQQQRVQALMAAMKPPGGQAGQAVPPPNLNAGPMQAPQQVLPNTTPAATQIAVPGPISMPATTPQTQMTQPGLPAPVSHFVTGTPNLFGTRSV